MIAWEQEAAVGQELGGEAVLEFAEGSPCLMSIGSDGWRGAR